MRTFGLAMAAAVLFVLPTSAFSQGIELGPGGIRVHPGYHEERYASGSECRELRQACLHREELGEQGRGNCQRYRRLCQVGRD